MTELTASTNLTDEVCVLGCLLEARALEMPDHECAHFEDGTTWTYSQALDLVRRPALSAVTQTLPHVAATLSHSRPPAT